MEFTADLIWDWEYYPFFLWGKMIYTPVPVSGWCWDPDISNSLFTFSIASFFSYIFYLFSGFYDFFVVHDAVQLCASFPVPETHSSAS